MTRNLTQRSLPTEAEILALQGHAIATGNESLRALTWTALGRSCRYAFEPVLEGERRQAAEGCGVQMETMRVSGEQLRVVTP